MTTETAEQSEEFKNIIDDSEETILAVAHPMWDELIKYSNEGKYGLFIKHFSRDLLHGLNEVEVGKQFARSELTRNLVTGLRLPGTDPSGSACYLPVPGQEYKEGR